MSIDTSVARGLTSLALAILFFTLGTISERRNKKTLDAINSAIKEWQTMEPRPEIVGKRGHIEGIRAKTEFLHELADN
jgi:hypothetical protein